MSAVGHKMSVSERKLAWGTWLLGGRAESRLIPALGTLRGTVAALGPSVGNWCSIVRA